MGLHEHEDNLISLLDPEIVAKLRTGIDTDNEGEDFLPDLNNMMEQTLGHDKITLLTDILNKLKNVNKKKWEDTKEEDLFPDILQNAKHMQNMCTLKDLQAISKAMEMHTGRCWFSSKLKKKQEY